MKTFTYKQALEILNTYFKGYQIVKVWDNIKVLNILFLDGNGKNRALLSTADEYFQKVEDFIIIEA